MLPSTSTKRRQATRTRSRWACRTTTRDWAIFRIRIWTRITEWFKRTGRSWSRRGKACKKICLTTRKRAKRVKYERYVFILISLILSFMRYFSAAFPGFWITCLMAFNPIRNGGKIISTEPAARDSLTCLHGLRVFSLGWVVMVHTYLQVFSIAGKVVALSQRQRHDDCMKSCLRSSLIILNLRLNKCIFSYANTRIYALHIFHVA